MENSRIRAKKRCKNSRICPGKICTRFGGRGSLAVADFWRGPYPVKADKESSHVVGKTKQAGGG